MKQNAKIMKQSYIYQLSQQRSSRKPIETPVAIAIDIYFWSKRRVDWDNRHKISMDACNGIVRNDDEQVFRASVEKHYDKDNPRIEFTIYEYDGK